ncbi:MAG: TolC family protein [Gammaproteobacteria bacterium]|nr:TolC family protein [Pseudomonadales bacterium]MCP5347169.1 TolC family protein [Pseudomonadales bacterium]
MTVFNIIARGVCLLAMMNLPLCAAAQQLTLTLRDAIELTLSSNPSLAEFEFRRQSLSGEQQTAALKTAPQFSAGLENAAGSGSLSGIGQAELTLSISRIIELGDKLGARTDVVSRRQAVLNAERKVVALDLIAETARRYIQLLAAQQRLLLFQSATAIARETLAATIARADAGRAPEAEREQATASLRLAELDEQSAGSGIDVQKIRLSSQWGVLQPAFDGVEGDLFQVEATLPLATLLEQLESNPALLVYADQERLRQAQLREARSRQSANLQLGAGIRHLAGPDDTGFVVQVSVPLFSSRRAEGAVYSARANLALVESERQQALLRLGTELAELDLQRGQAVNELQALQQDVIPTLRSALDQIRSAFDSGRYSYLELSAAQQALLDARFRLLGSAERVTLLTNRIEYLSGQSVTDFQTEVSQ